jgi:opacity protein-like surface antigen
MSRHVAAAALFGVIPVIVSAGSPGQLSLSEPTVVNFRTVVADLMTARSTFYAGGSGSLQASYFDGHYSQVGQNIGLELPLDGSVSGSNFTAFFGARRTAHNFVFGGELYVASVPQSFATTRGFELDLRPAVPNVIEGSATQTARMSSEVGLRAILGYDYEGFRVYGTLGIAGASLSTSLSLGGQQYAPESRTMIGAHYGVGMEFQATQQMSVRLEVSQSNFGNLNYAVGNSGFNGGGGAIGNVSSHSLSLAATRLTIGALFEF